MAYIHGICDKCSGKTSRKTIKLCVKCFNDERSSDILQRQKGDMIHNIHNGRWDLYRVNITKHARRAYNKSGRSRICKLCGYARKYIICHIKAVADFGNKATIAEINHLDNLVALCPNHHSEYDDGYITLEGRLVAGEKI